MAATPSSAAKKAVDPKIEETRLRLEQLKGRRQRIDARLQYLASKQARRADTRRKILVGAIILVKVERGEMDEQALKALLDKALTRANDRALFGLPGKWIPWSASTSESPIRSGSSVIVAGRSASQIRCWLQR